VYATPSFHSLAPNAAGPPEFPVEIGLTAAGRKAGRSVGKKKIDKNR
jgi:hypothetical protein